MNEKEISHPYLDTFEALMTIKNFDYTSGLRKRYRQLAKQMGMDAYTRLHLEILLLLPRANKDPISELFFGKLCEKYCYSLLSPQMLRLISQYSPLVELGAGNGYNAWLLEQMGASVEAIEAFPVEEGKNWFFATNSVGLPTKRGKSWTKIIKGDATNLSAHTDRTLLIIWPPINDMAQQALKHFKGKNLIFIANLKNCAYNQFYKTLQDQWHLIYSNETDGWSSFQTEWLGVYSRTGTIDSGADHPHFHGELSHSHSHFHDEHHQHGHGHENISDFRFPHSHEHHHAKFLHSHPTLRDDHHEN